MINFQVYVLYSLFLSFLFGNYYFTLAFTSCNIYFISLIIY
uniref:Uncharacterized protein n=1 Tax=Polysiphonia scopulorum TaxID=257860 RepID=A0A1Z1MIA9_9FLOR|nr:hypothetical protein [Polysiphonia scopulorum]ARW65629.1 hypothetical protein [Polysiphonia scopulorum]